MGRISERRIDTARRRLLAILDDPVLIQFAREKKRAKEIAQEMFGTEIAAIRERYGRARAEKFRLTKVRWVRRRIMGAL